MRNCGLQQLSVTWIIGRGIAVSNILKRQLRKLGDHLSITQSQAKILEYTEWDFQASESNEAQNRPHSESSLTKPSFLFDDLHPYSGCGTSLAEGGH